MSQKTIFKAFTDDCIWPPAYYAHSFKDQTSTLLQNMEINLAPPPHLIPLPLGQTAFLLLPPTSPALHSTISRVVVKHILFNGRDFGD